MASKARDYTLSTRRRLDILSGNQCAAPDCTKPLIAKDEQTILSKICHIEAASPGGARFNPNMTDDERRSFDNLIILCDECHSIIDNKINEPDYPVKLLKEWKTEHEANRLTRLSRQSSHLSMIINAIADISLEGDQYTETSAEVFNIEEKINYNCIVRYKFLIENNKIYYAQVASLYSELEKQGSFRQENLLRNINQIYLRTKGKYLVNGDDQKADNILDDVEEELINSIEIQNTSYDDIQFGVSVIMVDAFMRCKILEAPK